MEEVRKRKGEAERQIKDILNKYIEDTNTNVIKVLIMRDPVREPIFEIRDVMMETKL